MPETGHSATALEPAGPPAAAAEQLTLIDVDCHNISRPDSLDPYLDERWVAYRRTYGIRTRMDADLGITLRPFAARNDAFPPNGTPGSDPDFTRAQLLDEYGIVTTASADRRPATPAAPSRCWPAAGPG